MRDRGGPEIEGESEGWRLKPRLEGVSRATSQAGAVAALRLTERHCLGMVQPPQGGFVAAGPQGALQPPASSAKPTANGNVVTNR